MDDIWRRICEWLDKEEGRSLTLVNANPDFDGPNHVVEVVPSMDFDGAIHYSGETREEILDQIFKEYK